MINEELYDRSYELVEKNEMVYNRWENEIATYMAKKWPAAFESTKEITGSENVTLLEVAGTSFGEINDADAFINDFHKLLRALANGSKLTYEGKWS